MTDTLNITTIDDPDIGFFWVLLENCCVATFYYCVKDDSGFFTKEQAKKLANKLTDIATPLGTLHFESWAREIAQSMANIINLQISLGKLTSDGIKVEKTNDKER